MSDTEVDAVETPTWDAQAQRIQGLEAALGVAYKQASHEGHCTRYQQGLSHTHEDDCDCVLASVWQALQPAATSQEPTQADATG